MKLFRLSLTLLLISKICYSQTLEGEWKGTSIDSSLSNTPFSSPVGLFIKKNGNTYDVFSYCRGQNSKWRDTVVVSKAFYRSISEDSIYLEEIEVLKPKKAIDNCLIKMYLKLIKQEDTWILDGIWNSKVNECNTYLYGKITFKKIN